MSAAVESIESRLIAKGYKKEGPHAGDRDYVKANYYRVLYGVPNLPQCIANEKPPQLHVRETLLFGDGNRYHKFEIGFCNEAPQGWTDFKFYGLSEEEMTANLNRLEVALIAAWRALFVEIL